MFKVIISGSRDFKDYKLLCEKCDSILKDKHPNIIIIQGECRGADLLGKKYGQERGYKVLDRPAKWQEIEGKPEHLIRTKNGRKHYVLAGHERNHEMAEEGDALILFNKGTSGSNNMKEQMEKLGKPYREIKV